MSGSHPLLEQVPLTVSPFVNLPTATTLPYTYKTMPSTLPPSATGITGGATDGSDGDPSGKPGYVISQSGHAAHPDDIIASCRALQAHVAKLQEDADAELQALDDRIRARELAEKRRVAPGWLDSDARLLEPERKSVILGGEVASGDERSMSEQFAGMSIAAAQQQQQAGGVIEMPAPDEGEELDRAFGGMAFRSR